MPPLASGLAKDGAISHFVAPAHLGRGDLDYISKDKVVYSLHQKELARHSDMFRDARDVASGGAGSGPCPLEEKAVVLDALLPFLYGVGRARDLLRLKAGVALDVFETALKYQISTSVLSGMALALGCVAPATGPC